MFQVASLLQSDLKGEIMNEGGPSNISRRQLLQLIGVAAGAALAADTLFARQFARQTTPVTLPDMVYDPDLQVMVDPVTGQPVYVRAAMLTDASKLANPSPEPTQQPKSTPKPLPTVTSGCKECPKCDDNCDG